ncbi:Hint domain-containing protein [Cochlodiniinecator piscidefendens]|uniref:Hint domain-containing protein n=1 Tax=Cochlodiniinecator piscidefendens TaxID=2715756 RepID=UPI00140B73DA|nr:Hint domain-containing protein [Cochlodiniinecator piscidefendens]
MAQYTVTAFRWSGTGYNSQYNTSYTATIDDNDSAFQGGGDSDETISINGGAFGASSSAPYAIDVSFTDTNGNSHVENFNFFNTGGNWYFAPEPGSAFTTGATLGSYQSHTVGWNYSDITCFVRGTLIETDKGLVPVEKLHSGNKVLTMDGSYSSIQMVLNRSLNSQTLVKNPKLNPVRIVAGALGNGLPKRDLLVSRQHRMLVVSKVATRMFNQSEVLLAAIRLTDLPGIFVETGAENVEYFHLLFDNHKVIYAEGAPTESLYTGAEALKTIPQKAREEIALLFPQLFENDHKEPTACFIPNGKQQQRLVARHLKNNKPVLDGSTSFPM